MNLANETIHIKIFWMVSFEILSSKILKQKGDKTLFERI